MVLSKRKRDGEFVTWTPGSQVSTSEAGPSDPKRTRTGLQSSPQYMTEATVDYSLLEEARASRAKETSAAQTARPAPQPTASIHRAGPSPTSRAKEAPAPIQPTVSISRAGTSQPIASSSTPSTPVKKTRRKKGDDGGPIEKRAAKFKPKCPQNILDRVQRVMDQRICMINRRRRGDDLREEFSVLGSTGNVYTVTIDHIPICDCPDASKGNHCKHILFIFLKVLQVSRQSGFWYQKALLTSELEQIFAEAPLAPNAEAHPHVREAYARATGRIPATANACSNPAQAKNRRVPGPDDDCPICYDGMHGVAEASLTYCEQCGNAVHKECFQQWQGTSARTGKELTCVWCRAEWVVAPGVQAGVGVGVGVSRTAYGRGYINLANISGQSPVRDTSTYYHGPRRGGRYRGYQEYDDF
ncbi:hypothetical protein CVT25_004117 [Psilocybe cyanescens]|uniref:SWIM-type domain-containing protein n=1 Tax=Psilocybe cyanescens TaxID=93625 RepID=A0A409XKU0_PSICY|nr:hypothetical protein CVT25_004117 [Psilocybe cyanescens]